MILKMNIDLLHNVQIMEKFKQKNFSIKPTNIIYNELHTDKIFHQKVILFNNP